MKALFLVLVLAATTPLYASSILSPLTDSVNSGIINTKMLGDNALKNTNVDATVINGVATFSGEVNTKSQVEELSRIARSVSGIKGVDTSMLKVKNP